MLVDAPLFTEQLRLYTWGVLLALEESAMSSDGFCRRLGQQPPVMQLD